MTLARGRVWKAGAGGEHVELTTAGVGPGAARSGRVIPKALADASILAAEKLADAEARARAIVAAAEMAARDVRGAAEEEGRRAGAAQLATAWIKLRTEEAQRDEKDTDRSIGLARAMAERLLGEELALDPAKISAIARQVLASARQARRISLRAHPDDATVIANDLESLGLEGLSIEIHADPTRSRGSLLVDTDLGTLDANLPLQLDRLARSLRDSFGSR